MHQFLATMYPAGSNPIPARTGCAEGLIAWAVALATVLVLLLHGYGLGAFNIPPGQPAQITSQVRYDAKLSDPFFESEKWTNCQLETEEVNGRIVTSRQECPSSEKDPDCRKITARLTSSHDHEHVIDFCRARLLDDGRIELFIHNNCFCVEENLRILVEKGVFLSQFWTYYKVRPHGRLYERFIWTTTKQRLTLDKRDYLKGDVIKGEIEFECLQEMTRRELVEKYGREPYTVTIKGVFKTILE